MIGYARDTLGLKAHAGDFLEYDVSARLDVVCMWDTIEHQATPGREPPSLRNAARSFITRRRPGLSRAVGFDTARRAVLKPSPRRVARGGPSNGPTSKTGGRTSPGFMDDPGWQAELASIMAPGSIIGIRTGAVDNWFARWRGARWRQVLPPMHAHYCSRPMLSRLLLRHGFVVRHRLREGMYRSRDTMAFIRLQQNGRARGSIVG